MKNLKAIIIWAALILVLINPVLAGQELVSSAHKFNTTINAGGGGILTSSEHEFKVIVGQPVVGNVSSSEHDFRLGYLNQQDRTMSFLEILACISTYSCTGWVENLTDSRLYRTCSEITSPICGNVSNFPVEVKLPFEYFIFVMIPPFFAAMMLGGAFLLRREEHSFLRIILLVSAVFMVIPTIGFGYTVLQGSSASIEGNLDNFLKIAIGIVFMVCAYLAYYLIMKTISGIQKRKLEDLEY